MKLSNFLVGFAACALFSACANDETPGGNDLPQGNGEQAFIAVRLMAPNTMTKDFQAGSDAENAVTKGRFYFFDSEGNAVTVNTTDNTNYIDESTLSFNASSGNVEETTASPILVLDGSTDEWPTQMVVVLNPPSALDNTSKSLDNLRAAAAGYDGATSGQFVMSNSVYLDGSSQKVDAVDISDNITNDATAATNNPVTVYVERVLARVDVDGTGDMSDNTDGTGTTNDKINGYSGSNGTTEVQAVVKGWALANRNSQSHLLKAFDTSWNATTPFSGWNDATNHRSYWAYTGDITATKVENDSYNDMLGEATSALPANKYCQENTGTTDNTELVVIAELQVDGTATSIARYAGQYWLPTSLLQQFASQILAGRIYYKATADANYTALTADLLKLRPRTSAETSVAAYEAVLDLKNTYTTGYTFASDQSGTQTLDVDEVKDILNDYTALLWHNGKTYYHLPVNHALASEASTTNRPGIVRNHLYKINLTGVSGLGTPIPGVTSTDPDDQPDPEEPDPDDKPIDPENPDEEESFLAAEINILSWNIISQDVVLGE